MLGPAASYSVSQEAISKATSFSAARVSERQHLDILLALVLLGFGLIVPLLWEEQR